jgi:hypothetical protein
MPLLPVVDQRWYLLRQPARSGGTTVTVVELTHLVVLGSSTASLRTALRETCARPKTGKPRRPRVVVVASEADAAEIKGAMPGITVEIGLPPESLATVAQTNQQHEAASGGRLIFGWSDDLISDLFDLATDLWCEEPWSTLTDTEWLHVHAPSFDIQDGALIVLGAAKTQFGFMYFPEARAAQRFAALANLGARFGNDLIEDEDLGEYFALNLEPAHEVPPEIVRAGRRCDYFDNEETRFPLPVRMFATNAEVAGPLDTNRLIALGNALCNLVSERGDALAAGGSVSLTFEGITLSRG